MSKTSRFSVSFSRRPQGRRAALVASLFAATAALLTNASSARAEPNFLESLFGIEDRDAAPATAPQLNLPRRPRAQAAVRRRAANIRNEAAPRALLRVASLTPTLLTDKGAAPDAPAPTAGASVCVRLCDGYFFPIGDVGSASDLAAHEASCAKLCPGALARLYVVPPGASGIDAAVAAHGGASYASLAARLVSRPSAPFCACRSDAEARGDLRVFQRDFTLRPGDVVATSEGLRVVRPGGHFPFKPRDFATLSEARSLPEAERGALKALDRTMRLAAGEKWEATWTPAERPISAPAPLIVQIGAAAFAR